MDTLIKACEARKWPVSVPSGDRAGTTVDVQGCEIRVHLGESMRQAPREMTSLEKLWEKDPTLVQNSILTTWGKQTSGKCVRWV